MGKKCVLTTVLFYRANIHSHILEIGDFCKPNELVAVIETDKACLYLQVEFILVSLTHCRST